MAEENIDKPLIDSLLDIQNELENPKNNSTNPFLKSKYAALPDILNIVRPILTEYEILLVQNTGSCNGEVFVQTKLIHITGDSIESDKLFLKPDKANVQGIGSAITYGRRYQLMALLGIVGENEDDDGEARVKEEKPVKKVNKTKPKKEEPEEKPAKKTPKAKKKTKAKPKELEAEDPESQDALTEIIGELKRNEFKINANAIRTKARSMGRTAMEAQGIVEQYNKLKEEGVDV